MHYVIMTLCNYLHFMNKCLEFGIVEQLMNVLDNYCFFFQFRKHYTSFKNEVINVKL